MQQLINFLFRNKHVLLFLLLLIISIGFTVQNRSFHKSKFINSANFISGGIYQQATDVESYFSLKAENKKLLEENSRLRKLLVNTEIQEQNRKIVNRNNYKVYSAQVINNNYAKRNNFLTINKGTKDGIKEDLGVISSKGIVGIIRNTSNNYATVLSVLNSADSRINAQIKNSNHFATLVWDGVDPNILQLINLPKLANIKKGDTVETNAYSNIFPEGIPIGKIRDYNLSENNNYYEVDIELFNDMTNIKHVYIIENKNRDEIIALENKANE
ncbi:MAG: rod shape-determining protein MreC [Flavobacteriaceae bacterium]|nr:rod shape-determining protein MreC [Flavobacteriaceae bacterium]